MNEQDELNDKIFGKDVNAKLITFNKAVEGLGQEYADYFKKRKSNLESEEHDKIENNFMIFARGNGEEVFAINEDSDIEDEIKDKLINIYRRYSPIYV